MVMPSILRRYLSNTPNLYVEVVADAIDFYQKALNATELCQSVSPTGELKYAEIKICDFVIVLTGDNGGKLCGSSESFEYSRVGLHLYVDDVDWLFSKAVNAGAKVVLAAQDQCYGDRTAILEDPFGHLWYLATHKEDLTLEDINKRSEALLQHSFQSVAV